MAMRELVSGGAACSLPGSSSSSNPLGALANALIGSSSKTQVNKDGGEDICGSDLQSALNLHDTNKST